MRSRAPVTGIEAGGVDEDVELVLDWHRPVFTPFSVMALDGRLADVHQVHVGLVVDLEVARLSMGTRLVPKPWFFGISFSATAGSFTRWRILLATKSEISASLAALVHHARRGSCPNQMPKPGVL
jgi:hypothetical protein